MLEGKEDGLLKGIKKKTKVKKIKKKESQREQLGILERGSVFMTHNEVLNDCFGYNNKGVFQRAFKVLDGWDKCAVWFPKIAYKLQGEYVSSDKYNHFINILTDADKTIIEKNEDMNEMVKRADKSVVHIFVSYICDSVDYICDNSIRKKAVCT